MRRCTPGADGKIGDENLQNKEAEVIVHVILCDFMQELEPLCLFDQILLLMPCQGDADGLLLPQEAVRLKGRAEIFKQLAEHLLWDDDIGHGKVRGCARRSNGCPPGGSAEGPLAQGRGGPVAPVRAGPTGYQQELVVVVCVEDGRAARVDLGDIVALEFLQHHFSLYCKISISVPSIKQNVFALGRLGHGPTGSDKILQ